MSNKKNSVTLPVENAAVVDLSLILAALPGAVKGLEQMATAREAARVKCLAFADSVTASFGSLNVLFATSRNKDATDAEKAAYTALKEATLAEIWGADFLAWVNGAGDDKPRAPKRGQKAQPRSYWLQQKGAKWNKAGEGFVPRVMAFVEEAKAQAKGSGTARTADPIDAACLKNLTTAAKRIRTAADNGKAIPEHVQVHAFLAFVELASAALEKGKVQSGKAERAYEALRVAKIILK